MSVTPYLFSLGLLLGALLLSATSALAIGTFIRGLKGSGKAGALLVLKWIALFPLTALVWSAIGGWVGQLGLPISSLMPSAVVESGGLDWMSRMAHLIWWWAPALFLLSVPLTAQLLVSSLIGQQPWHSQVRWAGFYGVTLLPVVEEAFRLPGAVASLIPALHLPSPSSFFVVCLPLVILAVLWWILSEIGPRNPVSFVMTAEQKVRDSAIIIGLPEGEIWRRHLMRGSLLRRFAQVTSFLAVAVTLWVAYGCPGHTVWSQQLDAALRSALTDPQSPLLAALPYSLCALSLWALGRIFLPRPR